MSEESVKKRFPKAPHTVDSTNSSVLENDMSLRSSPERGSTINNNASGKFLTQTLRSYIDALKFDPSAQPMPNNVKKDSSLVVAELLGHNKNSKGANKRAQGGNGKSKVTFSSNKSSTAYLDQNFLGSSSSKSQQQPGSGKREKTKSSTNTVIREWGKRPLLVESEAPWTPRNRMYQNALKRVAKVKQMTENGVAVNNNPAFMPQAVGMSPSFAPEFAMQYAVQNNNNMNIPVIVQTSNGPQLFPLGQIPVAGQQQPILTGISPMPVDINSSRPMAVALDISQNPGFAFPQPGMVLAAQQQPQSVVYGQFNSEGVWVPIMQPAYPRQQQR